jgi:WD40 repeat protein
MGALVSCFRGPSSGLSGTAALEPVRPGAQPSTGGIEGAGRNLGDGNSTGPSKAQWTSSVKTLQGHGDIVSSVAFSPDSQYVASGSSDGTVKIWETGSGACVETLPGHGDKVSSVAFSPDGQYVVSGSWDGSAKIWDASSGACVKTLRGGGFV